MSRLLETLKNAGDGAFVTDENLRIDYWNEAAEEVLGFDSEEVLGQHCYQILQGHDEEGHLICKMRCQVAESALKAEPVPDYDVRMLTKQGESRWLNMSIFTYRLGKKSDKNVIVHLFRDINQKKNDERFFHRLLEVARRYHSIPSEVRFNGETSLNELTPREHEVLSLMANGHGTHEISQQLSISSNTVRNHVQNILQKLQVHTRLEAVAYAIRHDLID